MPSYDSTARTSPFVKGGRAVLSGGRVNTGRVKKKTISR